MSKPLFSVFLFKKYKKLDLSFLDVSNVTSASSVFLGCQNLKEINLSNWKLPKATTLGNFLANTPIEEVDLSDMRPVKCTSVNGMLKGNNKLKKVTFGNEFRVADGCDFETFLENAWVLTDINTGAIKANNPSTLDRMFQRSYVLPSVDLSGITESISARETACALDRTFDDCNQLESINLSTLSGSLTSASGTFRNCKNLKKLDIGNFDNESDFTGDYYSTVRNKPARRKLS